VLQGAESGRALLDATDALLLLVDHQVGLFQAVGQLGQWGQAPISGVFGVPISSPELRKLGTAHAMASHSVSGCG
jgi:hypothetical protein